MPSSPQSTGQEIARHLMMCHRAVKLYPVEHPQVALAITNLREALEVARSASGRQFVVDSSLQVADAESPLHRLNHVLRQNRVHKLSVDARATAREIAELCHCLELDSASRDPSTARPRERRLLEQAASWEAIKIVFMEFHDEVRRDHPLGELLKNAGMRSAESLTPIFESLPEAVSSRLRAELNSPQFLLKVSILRKAVQSFEQPTEDASARVNLIEEMVRAALPTLSDRDSMDPGEVIAKLRHLTAFVQRNIEALAGIVEACTDTEKLTVFRKELRDVVLENPTGSLATEAGQVQQLKERLGSLFRTGVAPSSSREPEWESPTETETPPSSPPSSGIPAPAPPATEEPIGLPRMTFDEARVVELYLFSVLDLVRRGKTANLKASWPLVTRNLQSITSQPHCLDRAVGEIFEFQAHHEKPEADELLLDILDREDSGSVARPIRTTLLPRMGMPGVQRFLTGMTRRLSDQAVVTLADLAHGADDELARRALEQLIEGSGRSTLLGHWIRTAPGDFQRPEVIEGLADRLEPAILARSFRGYFSTAPEGEALALITGLPPRIRGGEKILFMALESGVRTLVHASLRKLRYYPSEVVIKTLIAWLRRNDLAASFDPVEVTIILDSLFHIRHPLARETLEELRGGWLKFKSSYGSGIRKIFQSLEAEIRSHHHAPGS